MDNKPLGHKAYGSIPHLPNSRMGSADHHCEEGQARIATVKARDKNDLIIVQEKLDGSNVCVANVRGEIVALTRAGYLATTSPYEQHHYFHKWVMANLNRFTFLLPGERVSGEWLIQAHGTRYNLSHEPFAPFDLFRGTSRVCYSQFVRRLANMGEGIKEPQVISMGDPISVDLAMERASTYGFHGAIDPIEGIIYRIERKDVVDFLCKYVRPEKEDGKFLPENNGGIVVWNCDISDFKID